MWRRTSSSMTDGAKPSLDGEKNPNQVQKNLMLYGIVVEQDGVIAVRSFGAMAMKVTTMGGADQ